MKEESAYQDQPAVKVYVAEGCQISVGLLINILTIHFSLLNLLISRGEADSLILFAYLVDEVKRTSLSLL